MPPHCALNVPHELPPPALCTCTCRPSDQHTLPSVMSTHPRSLRRLHFYTHLSEKFLLTTVSPIHYPNTLINLCSFHLSLSDKLCMDMFVFCFCFFFSLCISHKSVSSMRAGSSFYFCCFLQFSSASRIVSAKCSAIKTYLLDEFLLQLCI